MISNVLPLLFATSQASSSQSSKKSIPWNVVNLSHLYMLQFDEKKWLSSKILAVNLKNKILYLMQWLVAVLGSLTYSANQITYIPFNLFKIYFATGIFGWKSRGFLKRGGSMIIGGPWGPVRRGWPWPRGWMWWWAPNMMEQRGYVGYLSFQIFFGTF